MMHQTHLAPHAQLIAPDISWDKMESMSPPADLSYVNPLTLMLLFRDAHDNAIMEDEREIWRQNLERLSKCF